MLKKKTKIAKGSPNSIRTTVPQDIASLLEVSEGDSVVWIADITSNGFVIRVEKADD